MRFFARRIRNGALFAVAALPLTLGLSGCFDLAQSVAIDRTGAGQYKVAVTAGGLVGRAMKDNHSAIGIGRGHAKNNHAVTRTETRDGKVIQTSTIAFKSLSDLRLGDDLMSLRVKGRDFLGLGPAHAVFRRTVLVANVRAEQAREHAMGNNLGHEILQTIFGDHQYVFRVTVPGSVEKAVPVRVGGHTITPHVAGDFYNGHTVTWRMNLADMLVAKRLTFEVDFAALGTFSDTQSVLEDAEVL